MLNLLFLLALLDKFPPLLKLRPNFPSQPLRSLAFLRSSAVEGLRSFRVELVSRGSTATVLLLSKFWLCFFVGASEALPLGVFLLSMSDVDERRGLIEIERYGDGLAVRGQYSLYCKSAVLDVGVTTGVTEIFEEEGYF